MGSQLQIPGELQQMYSELGITIRVVDWALDPQLQSWEAIWDYGALSLLTDCVYSNMADYEYSYIGGWDDAGIFLLEHFFLS